MGKKRTELVEILAHGVVTEELFSKALFLIRRYNWSLKRTTSWLGLKYSSFTSFLDRDLKAKKMVEEARADYERQFIDPALEKLKQIIKENIGEEGSPMLVSSKKKIQFDATKFILEKMASGFKKNEDLEGEETLKKSGLTVNIVFGEKKEDYSKLVEDIIDVECEVMDS